ncbi:MAG: hypothetical protein ACXVX9_09220 [Mycobacteriaceae bacterium]
MTGHQAPVLTQHRHPIELSARWVDEEIHSRRRAVQRLQPPPVGKDN